MPATPFGPEDEDAFSAFRDDLLDRFEQTSAGADHAWVASSVLDFKWSYLGGDLVHWADADIRGILFELYPRKVSLEPGDEPDVLRGFAEFLRFLAVDGVLAAPVDPLVDLIEASGADFATAMADRSRWGMAKGLFAGADAQGVDLSDPAQLEAYVQQHNALPLAERLLATGGAAGPAPAARLDSPLWGTAPLPVAPLPPEEDLRAQAAGNVLLRRVRALCAWVGKGRALTDTEDFERADAVELVGLLQTGDRLERVEDGHTVPFQSSRDLRELDYVFELTVAMQFVDVTEAGVEPGPLLEEFLSDDLVAWERIMQGLLGPAGPVEHRWSQDSDPEGSAHTDIVDGMLLATMVSIYRQAFESRVGELVDVIARTVEGIHERDGFDRRSVRDERQRVQRDSLWALQQLELAGALAFDVPMPDDEVYGVEYDTQRRLALEGTATLTPLGTWLVRRAAEGAGFPVAGGLAHQSAPDMLRTAADLPADTARIEVDAWVLAHADEAAALLAGAVASADQTERSLAFRALLRMGKGAEAAFDTLADDPELATFVTVWRVDAGLATPEQVAVDGPDGLVRLLGTVLDLWGPQSLPHWSSLAAGSRPLVGLVDQAWRSDSPATGEVLTALGSGHSDKAVAKAARKAAFKWRSRRSG